jgi:tellurite resistance protein
MFLATLTQEQKETFFCLAHNVVVSDGDLTADEELMMEDMRREMDLDTSFQSHYLSIEGIENIFESKRSRTISMISLIRLAYADGAFEIEEQCFLKELSHVFEISSGDFQLIDNWVRRLISLEREASAFW